MKQMMERIDSRFDVLDTRFDDIERIIDWTKVQVNFGQIKQIILVMSEENEYLYNVPADGLANRKSLFLTRYDNDYQSSGTKLYQTVILPQGTFQENLGASLTRYTKNDRKKTQEFLLGTLQLLLQAVKIELVYLEVKNFSVNAELMKDEWEDKIQSVRIEFERIDTDVKAKYHYQSGPDIVDFAAANTALSHSDFVDSLFNLLTGKYYWRDWIVQAYNPIGGIFNHRFSTCGGHHYYQTNGRNIVVSSKDKESPVMDLDRAESEMENVAVKI